jgi:pullulanase-type alpha-1,6-glucosidase
MHTRSFGFFRSLVTMLSLVSIVAGTVGSVPVLASHTSNPTSVTIAGSLQEELGCPGDWQPECSNTFLTYEAADDVWQGTFSPPAGSYEYKAALNGTWDENYGANASAGGDNLPLTVDGSSVKFYYDHKSHWVTSNKNAVIAAVPGDFQSELGCPGDWQPDCLRSWLQDPDGNGIYSFSTSAIPAGSYEAKVAHNESWDLNYGEAGVQNGPNIPFTVGTNENVTFDYDVATHILTITATPIPPPGPTSVTIAGSLQQELGCPGDWQPECSNTFLDYDFDDDVWQHVFTVPAGNWEYKAALNGTWDLNYGANAQQNGANIALNLGAETAVKFYYDHKSHWIIDNQNATIATAAGSFQSELGCPGDWQPDCLRSWLQDPDGDGLYSFSSTVIPAGSYEAKVTINESWDENYGEGGAQNGPNIPFTVPAGATVHFTYNAVTHILTINAQAGGLEPGDELLVRDPVRSTAADQSFYFAMTDRFANGLTANDTGGDSSGDPLVNGYLATDKGYYHGGDLAGIMAKLDYLQGLGVTAIWMTPPFTNRWVQGDGTIAGSSAGYHGYWQLDFTQIDPHFGTNQEMIDLVAAAHARGMKVFFDIILNHTADVISYEGGSFAYRSKADYPYRDASGNIFDDRDYAGTDTFPPLDPAVSFPYVPFFPNSGDDTAKSPAWLNNPIYYHNRGNSTFTGENSLYGDFFGLDDLFTEHPDVVNGLIDIHKNMITEFHIDGFRVDTAKHANDELWEAFVPEILAHAEAQGNPDFFLFGEVFDSNPVFTSHYTTALPYPAVLDFGFDGAAKAFASASQATDLLGNFFASDDYFTDDDSNAYALVKFIGNHDIGRFGHDIDVSNPGAADSERVARMELGYGLMFFSRGAPLIYYGDEQGFTGDGGDKDARQDMFPSAVASYNDDDLIGTDATTAEDNFDPTHVLYQAFSQYAELHNDHLALRQGAQIHRYSEANAGIYAFSRIERGEKVEYLVVLNNSEANDTATFATETPNATFTALLPAGADALTSDADGNVTVSLPGLSFAVYQADQPAAMSDVAPNINILTPAPDTEVSGRFEIEAALSTPAYGEVTFAVSVDGGDYQVIGTDDNAPYQVFFDASGLSTGSELTLKAIVKDLAGNLNANKVSVTVAEVVEPPQSGATYAVIHYFRPDGDYGDHTTGNYNDFWGLHLWDDIEETIEWTAPKPFLGEDEYGRFAWVKLAPGATNVGFIVHRGDTKDGTTADRFFNPSLTPEIWLKADDATTYTSQASAQGFVTIHYHRDDGDYTNWGLHLWGDAIDPSEGTTWENPKPQTGIDDFGAFWNVQIVNETQPVNFIIHRGDEKDPGPDQSFIPQDDASIWIISGNETIYGQQGAAQGFATLHYRRPAGDYGDYSSNNYADFWGLHTWGGATDPGWTTPRKPVSEDLFGVTFRVDLFPDAQEIGYIFHRGDEKDPGPDQFLTFDQYGYEVWQLQGADPESPYILPILFAGGSNPGNIAQQSAYWVSEDTIAWEAGDDSANTYRLCYAANGGLQATDTGITGGSCLTLTRDPAGLSADIKAKFPHLAALPALKINSADLTLVPSILRGQIAVSALDADGNSVNATGLQIPGVLDDLYTTDSTLGVGWDGNVPTIRLWAPTAKSVTLHLFDDSDPATTSTDLPMEYDAASGTWSLTGEVSWKGKYYLYEVEVYVHSTGQVEHNLVTDPYSFSLAMNSTRSQIVDLGDTALQPTGWEEQDKPALVAPEDISIYELHVRDYSVADPLVPADLKGTYKAFTLTNTNGYQHLKSLASAGLTHLHLLPTFDIATINEDKSEWQSPDPAVLATYPSDSDQQQAAVALTADLDAFNWGYDPLHYTVPEGSYSTDPDGSARIVEFREMVQSLNDLGLRLVIDVVYNHTSASGQNPNSVLDRIVPGYYHRLNDSGAVESSTCCANTASEHNMMEKLMVDSVLAWAKEYKVDGFRFDLMGHHMVSNMQAVRDALDALTLAEDGVDGKSIYVYGEGWNFGEVANNARGVNATQQNLAGTGIGTFNDRSRDAVRGVGPFDSGQGLLDKQGFANGMFYDPKATVPGTPAEQLARLLLQTDQVKVGMAGNLANFEFIDRNGNWVTGAEVDYNGSPAGYNLDPQEDISYIEAHDNQTLFDINVYAAPQTTSLGDRVRMQIVGLSTVVLGQGVPFIHAGSDLLRSKSLDRNSYNSGDWFNTLDFTKSLNNFGVGLPPAGSNQSDWSVMQPLLADSSLKPGFSAIDQAANMFSELLRIRSSSRLFRLETEAEVRARLTFLNNGPEQLPGLIVMTLSDQPSPDLDKNYENIVVLINANDEAQTFTAAEMAGKKLTLHPVQRNSSDPVVQTASFTRATGSFNIPARTTAVFILYEAPQNRVRNLIGAVQALKNDGTLNNGQSNSLIVKLQAAIRALDRGNTSIANSLLTAFIADVNSLLNEGVLNADQAQPLIDAATDIIYQTRGGF